MELLVKVIFVASCTAPLVGAALRARRRAALGWWLAAAVASAACAFASPMAVALDRIDALPLRAGCTG